MVSPAVHVQLCGVLVFGCLHQLVAWADLDHGVVECDALLHVLFLFVQGLSSEGSVQLPALLLVAFLEDCAAMA